MDRRRTRRTAAAPPQGQPRRRLSLRESEQRYRLVIETLAEGVLVLDRDTRIVASNASAQRILGLREDEISGRLTFDPSWRTIHEDGSPFPPEEYPAVVTVRTGQPATGVVMGVYQPGGALSWISINSRPLMRDGVAEPEGAVVSFADITDRKNALESLRASEERHRSVVAALAEGVLLITRDGMVAAANESAARIFGRPVEGMLGPVNARRWRAIREDGTEFPVAEQPVAVTFRTGVPQTDVIMGVLVEDEPIRWISENSHPLTAAGAEAPHAVVVSITDITERKREEGERRVLEQQLLQSQKMEAIGTLAGGIAHDFNNILFAIQGNAEMARLDLPADHPSRGSLDEMLRACERAKALVQRILAFSRRHETHRRPLHVGPIVAETVKLMRSSLPPGVELVRSEEGEDPLVLADEVELQQVVMNLCTNAIHAMRGRDGRIIVRHGAVEVDAAEAASVPGLGAGPHFRLAVSDVGHGIDPDVLGRVFDPFFTTKPPGEGTGLGLAVVRQVAASHEGAITVRSAPGQGATFIVYLPLARAEDATAVAVTATPPRPRGDRVLFVDDEPAIVRLADRLLSRVGFNVKAVGSAAEALALVRKDPTRFDLVLSDVTMPRMGGLELAAEIRRIRPGLPIVLTTGDDTPVDADAARALGVREILSKPWTTVQLLDILERHLAAPVTTPRTE